MIEKLKKEGKWRGPAVLPLEVNREWESHQTRLLRTLFRDCPPPLTVFIFFFCDCTHINYMHLEKKKQPYVCIYIYIFVCMCVYICTRIYCIHIHHETSFLRTLF